MMSLPDESAIILRPAALSDLEALLKIDSICFPPEIAYPRREIAFLLRSSTIPVVVAGRTGIPIGFAALRYFQSGGQLCGDLVTIDVLPQFRRMGVGIQLYSALESGLLENGGSKVELHVSVENAGALNFYEGLGFCTIGRVPNYYPNAVDAWQMEKKLR